MKYLVKSVDFLIERVIIGHSKTEINKEIKMRCKK